MLKRQEIYDTDKAAKLQIHEEQLDIAKEWIQTGEVTVRKETFTEQKTIVVPITREELVIEKKILDTGARGKMDIDTETIRIPLSEEEIEIIKHPVRLEKVSVYRRQFEEIECIAESLKKERVNVETIGTPQVIYKYGENHLH